MGLGTELVEAIKTKWPKTQIIAKVRDDLAANHFWKAIGFQLIFQTTHKTSRNLINHYQLIQEQK
jgi:hypothetical protein